MEIKLLSGALGAEIKGVDQEIFEKITTDNFFQLFSKAKLTGHS